MWWQTGIAAAIGLVVYFVGAVAFHLRVGDFKGIVPVAFMLVLAVTVLVLKCQCLVI